MPRVAGRDRGGFVANASADEQGRQHQGDRAQQLDQHVQRRPGGVLVGIAHRIADDRRLVSVCPLAERLHLARVAGRHLEHPRLDVLLGVVPGAADVVEEGGQDDATDGADHQHSGHSQPARRVGVGDAANRDLGVAGEAEDEAHGHRHADCQEAGRHHRAEGGAGGDVDGAAVVRARGTRHYAGVLAELASHFFDDLGGGRTHGADRQAGEEEDEHHAHQPADEDVDGGEVEGQVLREGYVQPLLDLVQVGAEQEEGGQAGGGDGVALGERLGGVADGVQGVGDVTGALRGAGHLRDAAGVIGDRPEGVHREDVGSGHEHAHGGDGGSEHAAAEGRHPFDTGFGAEYEGANQGEADGDGGSRRRLEADGGAGDDIGGRSRAGGFGDLADGAPGTGGVVLRDVDEGDAGADADKPAEEEPVPGVPHHHLGGYEQPGHGQQRDEVVAVVQGRHRVAAGLAAGEEGHGRHAGHGGEDAEGAEDKREDHPLQVAGDGVDDDAEDHGADVLGGHGLEQVGATAGAVADVVAHEVGDHRGVARVVLRYPRLDLADEVSADVGGLRIDAAAELGEQRHEAGAEAEADYQEGSDRFRVAQYLGVDQEDAGHSQEAEGDDQEAGDGATAERDRDRFAQGAGGGGGGAAVRPHGDVHADVAGEGGGGGAHYEGDAGKETLLPAADHLIAIFDFAFIADDLLHALRDAADDEEDGDGGDDGQHRDGAVLTSEEGHRPLEDHGGDVLHLGGAGITAEDVPGQPEGEEYGGEAGGGDQPD